MAVHAMLWLLVTEAQPPIADPLSKPVPVHPGRGTKLISLSAARAGMVTLLEQGWCGWDHFP